MYANKLENHQDIYDVVDAHLQTDTDPVSTWNTEYCLDYSIYHTFYYVNKILYCPALSP